MTGTTMMSERTLPESPAPLPALDNRLTLAGCVLNTGPMRYSPAGLPIFRFTLEHRSQQWEADILREARCRVTVLACGYPLAPDAGRLPAGALIRVSGFLCRANHRQGEAWLVLHAQQIEILEPSQTC